MKHLTVIYKSEVGVVDNSVDSSVDGDERWEGLGGSLDGATGKARMNDV